MSHLAKSLTPSQEIVVQLTSSADREEVARRLSLDGIRVKVLRGLSRGTVKLGVNAPAGLTPVRRDALMTPRDHSVGRLALARRLEQEIVVTLKEGADVSAVLDWLASDGVSFQAEATRTTINVIHIKAINELLILRDELITEAVDLVPLHGSF